MDETKPKRASGGARATIKRRESREAAEKRRLAGEDQQTAAWLAAVDEIGSPPTAAAEAHAWLGRAAVLVVHATMRDVAVPPEQMRRDVMRQIEQASRVMDPAKLAEQITSLEESLEELDRARVITQRETATAYARTSIS